MTSYADYIKVLPDYADNDVISGVKQRQTNDDDYDDAQAKSRDTPVTSEYEHPQPGEVTSSAQQQQSTYQPVTTSRRLPSNDLQQLVTSDTTTYDEIADIPSPPPPRPGWWVNWFDQLSDSGCQRNT